LSRPDLSLRFCDLPARPRRSAQGHGRVVTEFWRGSSRSARTACTGPAARRSGWRSRRLGTSVGRPDGTAVPGLKGAP